MGVTLCGRGFKMEASESIIEGVGDELLWTFLSLFILLLSVSYLMFCSDSRRRDNVHPEQVRTLFYSSTMEIIWGD